MRSILIFLFFLISTQLTSNQVLAQSSNGGLKSSVNGLLLSQYGDRGNNKNAEAKNGFQIQEVELRFSSNVDAYFYADATLALEKEGDEFHLHPEEVFIKTLKIPNLTIKAGKFYAKIGKHNGLHTHSFPFIDAPLINQSVLGEEGLNESGISAAILVPFDWFSELYVESFSAKNESLFASPAQDDLATNLAFKNLWDLSDSSTLELILGHASGQNQYEGTTQLTSASFTYKWRPVANAKETSFHWTTEFLQSSADLKGSDSTVGGVSTWLQYQFNKNWWIQSRGEYLGLPAPSQGSQRRYSLLAGFVPTEFSAVRLQYDLVNRDNEEEDENRFLLQLSFSIGDHPAHSY